MLQAGKPSPCLTPIPMTKGLLIFPSTITLAWAPPNVIFTSHSIFFGIPKLTSDSRSFFLVYAIKSFFKINEEEVEVMSSTKNFSSICLTTNIWSVVPLCGLKPHWYSPKISSEYYFNRSSTILDSILYSFCHLS